MSFHSFANRISRLAANLVPAFQSGHVATPPTRITTMQTDAWIDHWRDRRDQYNAALSRENDFPAVPDPRVPRVTCGTWLRATGPYGVELTLLMANPADLPFTTLLRGYRPTASLHWYMDRHPSESSL